MAIYDHVSIYYPIFSFTRKILKFPKRGFSYRKVFNILRVAEHVFETFRILKLQKFSHNADIYIYI